MKITKADFELLTSPSVTHATYQIIIGKICERIDEIFRKICEIQGRKLVWYDFDNSWQERDGYFDPSRYAEQIGLIAEYSSQQGRLRDIPYESSFPTKWLWEDFEETVKKETQEHFETQKRKNDEKQLRAAASREKRLSVIATIKNKLTKEELSYIRFN